MEEDTKSQNTEVPMPAPSPTPMSSGPVMDVVPPHAARPADSQEVAVEEEPNQPPTHAAEPEKPTAKPKRTNAQKPGPIVDKPHTAPVAAILLAILVFAVLAGLAYYAYSKG